jgi:hypothetical protein
MRLLFPSDTLEVVWSGDSDVELPDESRFDADGNTYMLALAPDTILRPGALVWRIRPVPIREAVSAEFKTLDNLALAKAYTASVRVVGEESIYSGHDVERVLEANGFTLAADLAHAIGRVTKCPESFRRSRPRTRVE